ncbi:MAG: Clp protease N-terminal domain-containing protein, partial [Candidatus Binataceae bacterium]
MPSSGVMISRELQVTLQLAMTEAVNRRHEYVCLEHLLYAMLHDVTTSNILRHCGADIEALKRKLAHFLDEQVERLPKEQKLQPRYALGVQRALQRAAVHVQSAGHQEINGGNVLVAMFHENESHAVYFLNEEGATRFDVINFISHGVSKIGADDERGVRGADNDDHER